MQTNLFSNKSSSSKNRAHKSMSTGRNSFEIRVVNPGKSSRRASMVARSVYELARLSKMAWWAGSCGSNLAICRRILNDNGSKISDFGMMAYVLLFVHHSEP